MFEGSYASIIKSTTIADGKYLRGDLHASLLFGRRKFNAEADRAIHRGTRE